MLYSKLTTLHVVTMLLEHFAGHPEATRQVLLHGSGIRETELGNPDVRITRLQEQQVCRNGLQFCAELGLELGCRMHVSAYGLLGYAALSSNTFGEAWDLLLQYPALLGTYFRLELVVEDELAWISASDYCIQDNLEVFNVEMCLASLKLLCEDLLGRPLRPSAAQFRHAPPDYAEHYGRSFGCARQFEAARNAFAFPASLLLQRLPLADPVTNADIRARCRRLNAEFSNRQLWLERVRELLLADLAAPPTLVQLAVQLHCSPRSLRRHLQALGTSYQGLLDDMRFTRAKHLLGEQDMPVCRVAELLGFSETASFRHAFQRWSGIAPSRYRA
ncbi:AraC family transcriptional regulator [Pseudomonas sp. N040]|uniref:AraC family transcriptional regulator n=1 Tax=Pseudomonas sp. N040 TaxID=2785325 RepID=UPI0018A2C36B|nr:AraC family transcriptional regulator [Pseudomonas sp. N040]MBF7728966.1 AraC family transcriptional regulator [Pseudomonas sp. N040]MBW7012606.1 AraC family transcriptional regulator [Pseudomonas sp. N040]